MFRSIPSTDISLQALLKADPKFHTVPKSLLKYLVVAFWNEKREEIKKGACVDNVDLQSQLSNLQAFVLKALKPNLQEVLNGSGVIIHTNLGRSILAEKACEAVELSARNYCNLEMDLQTGERGSRHAICLDLIKQLTGAEDAIVVNNNAAAVLLILDTLCKGGETVLSRGELVEIGGSFRIPDIMAKSGTILKEVGTTNRTHLADYQQAINAETKAIMRVHASNFRIIGFQSSVSLKDLKALALKHELPLIFDLGSGNLLDFSQYGLDYEPSVREIIAQGTDLVSFSGDKALGGPQAGIIAGKTKLVERLKKNPLARALRCDKLCLAALEATLRLYLDPEEALQKVPTARMISLSPESLTKEASNLANSIQRAFNAANIFCELKLKDDFSRVGGGTYPECGLPTTLVCLYPEKITAQDLRFRLLKSEPPLIGRLEHEAFCLDPRTLKKSEFPKVVSSLCQALSEEVL